MSAGFIRSAHIFRIDWGREVYEEGYPINTINHLVEVVDETIRDKEKETTLTEAKRAAQRLPRESPEADTIGSTTFKIYYVLKRGQTYSIAFICTCNATKQDIALAYLADLAKKFSEDVEKAKYDKQPLRPYACISFEDTMNEMRKDYNANGNVKVIPEKSQFDAKRQGQHDAIQRDLSEVTWTMKQNINKLAYRGTNLDRMGEQSSTLLQEAKHFRRAAVRINWDLLLKQYGPIGALAFIMIVFMWWRFF